MRMKKIELRPEHQAFKTDIDALLIKHGEELSPPEILALVSQVCGMVLAMQNQNTMTKDDAIAIIQINIEVGNAIVIANLQATQGRA